MLRRDQPAMTILLGALIAIAPLAMDIYLASMPSMTRALETSAERVQLTLSVYMFGWGAAQLFAGPLSDRFGRRTALICGLVLFVTASIACALAQNIHTLIAARLAQAIGMAVAAVVPRAVVRDLYSGERAAHMLSVMGIVLGVAPILAPILGSQLHVWLGWRANFVFVAVYGLVALACVVGGLPETLAARNARATHFGVMVGNYARLMRSRRYMGYLLVTAFASCGVFAFIAGSAFVFVAAMGNDERTFGLLFGAVMLGNISGAAISSRLVIRLGIDRMIRYSTSLMLVSGLTMGVLAWSGVTHVLAIVVPMFLFMVSLMTTIPPAAAGALTPFPDIAGSAASLFSFCQFVLASTSALIVGMTFDGTQRPMATVIAVASVLAFTAFRMLIPRPPGGETANSGRDGKA